MATAIACPVALKPVDGKFSVGTFIYVNPHGKRVSQELKIPCRGNTDRELFMARSLYDAMLVDCWCALAEAGARQIEYHEAVHCGIWKHSIEEPP
jgi:hypothetical protein